MNRNPHVAVVGATGAVGIEMIKTLEKRIFPVGKLTLLASALTVATWLFVPGVVLVANVPSVVQRAMTAESQIAAAVALTPRRTSFTSSDDS